MFYVIIRTVCSFWQIKKRKRIQMIRQIGKNISNINSFFKGGGGLDFFSFFRYVYQHCFICRPSDSTVSKDTGNEPRTVATLALTARRTNPRLDTIHINSIRCLFTFSLRLSEKNKTIGRLKSKNLHVLL